MGEVGGALWAGFGLCAFAAGVVACGWGVRQGGGIDNALFGPVPDAVGVADAEGEDGGADEGWQFEGAALGGVDVPCVAGIALVGGEVGFVVFGGVFDVVFGKPEVAVAFAALGQELDLTVLACEDFVWGADVQLQACELLDVGQYAHEQKAQ